MGSNIKSRIMKKQILVLTAVLSIANASISQIRWYVKASATGSNDGSSWTNACTDLQTAMAAAQEGDEVWVAAGVYRPTAGTDRAESFEPASGVKLYGGFAGTENLLSERDWKANPTVLSGDIGTAGDSADNSYNVVYLEEPDTNTVVDGFTVRDGNADYSSPAPSRDRRRCGGGMYIMGENWEAYPEIRNCIFVHNTARGFGGGVMVNGAGDGSAAPYFVNCRFERNRSLVSSGGGLARLGGSWLEREKDLDSCVFLQNEAGFQGGGFYYSDSERADDLDITGCQFDKNSAIDNGGGAYVRLGRENPANIHISECDFRENSGKDGGAFKLFPAGLLFTKNIQIDNCQFDGHTNYGDILSTPVSVIMIDILSVPGVSGKFENCILKENVNWSSVINVSVDYSTLYIKNFKLTHNIVTSFLWLIGGVDMVKIQDSKIINNQIEGISSISALNCQYQNCIIENNKVINGAFFSNAALGGELLLSNCLFINLTFQSILLPNGLPNLNVYNTIILDVENLKQFLRSQNHTKIAHCYFDTLDCSQLFSNVTCGPGLIIGGDPMFAAPDSGDYRLLPCSPLLDAGNNTYLSPADTTDLDGAPRIQRSAVDIGPYETPAPALAADPEVMPSCPGGLSGSVDFSIRDACEPLGYAWTSGSGGMGQNLTGLAPGVYAFTITDATGSAFTAGVTVPEGDAPEIIPLQQPVICGDTLGGSATAGIEGGEPPYTFQWQGGSTDSLLNGLAAGFYPVTVTDARGCTATGAVQVTREGNLDVNIQVTEISCFGAADGAFSALPENGKPPFTWHWNNGSAGPGIGALGPSTYFGTVTDALGCSLSLVLPLTEPDSLWFSASVQDASGQQVADGSVVITSVSGGTEPFEYQWETGSMNDAISGLLPGFYSVTVTDAHECTAAWTFEVKFISGVNEAGGQAWLLLYPNPAGEKVTLQGDFRDKPVPEMLELLDAGGRLIRSLALPPGSQGQSVWRIPLEGLSQGKYEVVLRTSDGKIVGAGKLIKH